MVEETARVVCIGGRVGHCWCWHRASHCKASKPARPRELMGRFGRVEDFVASN